MGTLAVEGFVNNSHLNSFHIVLNIIENRQSYMLNGLCLMHQKKQCLNYLKL